MQKLLLTSVIRQGFSKFSSVAVYSFNNSINHDTWTLSFTMAPVSTVGWLSAFFRCLKKRFWNIKIVITPSDMEASATLKIGLKNSNSSPPHTGNHVGKC